MIRLGLCCTFLEEDIKFRAATVRHVSRLEKAEQRRYLFVAALHNACALGRAIDWCVHNGVGAFRIPSGLLPLYTHDAVGYALEDLDETGEIRAALREAGEAARRGDIRLSFHPDQFVVPGSPTPASVEASLRELEYQAMVASLVGAQQLTIHGGGRQGGKEAALERLAKGLLRLSPHARGLVALENDDRSYTVRDLLPLCDALGVPLIYDVHHHRCNPDDLSVEDATALAARTWRGREPWAHLSSPAGGWKSKDARPHADYIAPSDFPRAWLGQTMTVDVEAKAKEQAVLRLKRWLASPRRMSPRQGHPRP